MEKSRALAVVLVVAVLGCGWFFARSLARNPSDAHAEPNGPAPSAANLDLDSRRATDASALPATRTPATAPTPTAEQPTADLRVLQGIVVGIDGTPRAGVRLTFVAFHAEPGKPAPETTSGPLGAFRFELRQPREGRVLVSDPELVGVLVPRLFGGVPESELLDLTVVVASRRPLEGRVQDQDGQPVPQAVVSMSGAGALRARIPRNFDRCEEQAVTTRAGADGSFVIADAYAVPGAALHPAKEGYFGLPLPVPEPPRHLILVLHRQAPSESLRGTVVDEAGKAVPNAEVSLGNLSVRTAADGTFTLDLGAVHSLGPSGNASLIAFGPEPSVGRLAPIAPEWRQRSSWPKELVVRLGPPLPEITGHVEYADGQRVAGFEAALLDTRENDLLQRLEAYRDDLAFATGVGVRDDPSGFRLTCLEHGTYRVRIRVAEQLLVHVSQPVRAGARDVVIRLPREGAWPSLRILVVDPRGEPVAGADAVVHASDAASEGSTPWSTELIRTDAQGILTLPPLASTAERLLVKATELADWEVHKIADLVRGAATRLVVPRACQARVELVDPNEDVDGVVFEDANQRQVTGVVTNGAARYGTPTLGLQSGRSWVFTLSEGAVKATLKKGNRIVRGVPVALTPGTLNVLRL